jgi:hypothetical protein
MTSANKTGSCVELVRERRVVVNLSIEDHHDFAVRRADRLAPRFTQVPDCEPAVNEANGKLLITPNQLPAAIRSAMG